MRQATGKGMVSNNRSIPMNPDNPYAAPQTIGQPPPVMATSADAGRLMFMVRSTERLKELLDYSYAIQQMHIMWILLAVMAVGGFLILSVITVHEEVDILFAVVTLGVMVLIFFRVTAGYSGAKIYRGFAMLCDGLLTAGSLWLIVILLQDGSLIIPIFVGFIGLHAASSFLAHYHARELFEPNALKQEDLAGVQSDAPFPRRKDASGGVLALPLSDRSAIKGDLRA